ncbi:flavodoxin [Spirochaetia bacterium]|nr:flavodoxin [Spirochaetia bacterium]
MKTVVIYASKYGAAKQYAAWIAEELHAVLLEQGQVSPAQLQEFDCVIYGGGLYASGILGASLVTKNPCKILVVFTVGLADPKNTDYTHILKKNFSPESTQPLKVFHLRGGIDYKKLGPVHRIMMAMLKRQIAGKPDTAQTEEDRAFVEIYGKKVDFTDRYTIAPLVEFVRSQIHGG